MCLQCYKLQSGFVMKSNWRDDKKITASYLKTMLALGSLWSIQINAMRAYYLQSNLLACMTDWVVALK